MFNRSVSILSALAVSLATTMLFPSSVFAQTQKETVKKVEANAGANGFGLPDNTLNDGTLRNILGNVFLAASSIALIFMVIGGLRYVLSDGNEQKVKQAKETIVYAVVGLVIALSAYSIVRFVIRGVI